MTPPPLAAASERQLGKTLVATKTTVRFTGIDTHGSSLSGYGGIIHAPRGLNGPSFALRLVASGWLDTETVRAARSGSTGPEAGRFIGDTDFQAGYRAHSEGWYGGVYVGARWRQQSTDDGGSANQETTLGVKLDVELSHYPTPGLPLFIDLRGSFSTVSNSYWARLQLGRKAGPTTLGPEFALLGDVGYDQLRTGAFVHIAMPGNDWHVALSAGWVAYLDREQRHGNSVYGAIGVAKTY